MKYLRPRGGFTLIEMLVVVVIIAVLVAISIPALFRAVRDARARTCAENIRQIENAAALHASQNNGAYPAGTVAVFTADATYFPDGAPACPWAVGYAWQAATNNSLVNKATHFGTAWPTTHVVPSN